MDEAKFTFNDAKKIKKREPTTFRVPVIASIEERMKAKRAADPYKRCPRCNAVMQQTRIGHDKLKNECQECKRRRRQQRTKEQREAKQSNA